MKCPFCAEEIQAEAVVCRFCRATKTGEQWQMSPGPLAERAPGYFTMRFAGAAFGISALFEVMSIGSEVLMFGALRGGAIAYCYHGVYAILFAALFTGLWNANRWGYRLLFFSTCFYTLDNLRYVLDRAGMKAQIDRQLNTYGAVRDVVDADSLLQLVTLSAIVAVLCWWGFLLYARARRSYFAA